MNPLNTFYKIYFLKINNIERDGRKISKDCVEHVFLQKVRLRNHKEKEKWEVTGRDGKSHIRGRNMLIHSPCNEEENEAD
jgi:hypothetical protein